jgi:elongation factor Ts
MVELNCETDFVGRSEGFRALAHELALQIAAAAPLFIREEDIPADVLEHERNLARAAALEEGKPEAVAERIVEGRLAKFMDETVLLRQVYIRDDSLTIQQLMMDKVASIGENLVIRRFVRWELGRSAEE